MPHRTLQQAIQAMQAGDIQQGARLLRVALKDETLSGNLRAVALMWLAETDPDRQFKIDAYNQALQADPNNTDVQQRLSHILSQSLPDTGSANPPPPPNKLPETGNLTPPDDRPPPPPQFGQPQNPMPPNPYPQPNLSDSQPNLLRSTQTMHPPPVQPQATAMPVQGVQRTVGIYGGPNGNGTGFFITMDGIVATTRYIVGGNENVTVAFHGGQQLPAQPIRAYPEYDLAFLRVNVQVQQLLPVSNTPTIAENAQIIAVSHDGQNLNGNRRQTSGRVAEGWFPTTIKSSAIPDAGGHPVFSQNYLVGMLTRNASRTSGMVSGLHISMIYRLLEQFMQDAQRAQRTYCIDCGFASQAQQFGAFYCEVCGGVLPSAREVNRFPQPNMGRLYGEEISKPCPNCQSRAGFYDNQCLRCGHDLAYH